MKIETKNDFILSVTLSAIWLVIGIILFLTNLWILGLVFFGCGAYSAISPVKYYIATRRAIPTDSLEDLNLDDVENN